MHSTESSLATGPSNILFPSVFVCTFQPRNFTDWAVKGYVNRVRYTDTTTLTPAAICRISYRKRRTSSCCVYLHEGRATVGSGGGGGGGGQRLGGGGGGKQGFHFSRL